MSTFIHPNVFTKHLHDSGFSRTLPKTSIGTAPEWELDTHDLTSLKIRTSYYAAFLSGRPISRPDNNSTGHIIDELSALQMRDTLRFAISEHPEYFFVIIPTLLSAEQKALIVDYLKPLRSPILVPIFDTDMHDVVNATGLAAKSKILGRVLRRSLDLTFLSPYVLRKPATGYRFFGRRKLVRRLSNRIDENFTIIGNRRIGKTSLLKEVRRNLFREDKDSLFVEIYGANTVQPEQLMHKIAAESMLGARIGTINTSDATYYAMWSHQLKTILEKQNKSLHIFIDEIDAIIRSDRLRGFKLLNLLRELGEHSHCRIFFAGFREAMLAERDSENPLFNFTKFERLEPLKREEAYEMIQTPLANLGLELSTNLANVIYSQSSGHPELIQHFCRAVVEFSEDHGRLPDDNELVESVMIKHEFESAVFQTFIQNCTALERLAYLLLIKDNMQSAGQFSEVQFSEKDILARVRQEADHRGFTELLASDGHLVTEALELSGTILKVRGTGITPRYRNAVPSLPHYCVAKELDVLIDQAVRQFSERSTRADTGVEPEQQF